MIHNKLITFKTCSTGFEANLLKEKLEDSGIMAFVFDENMVTMNPLYNVTVGGIKLKIRESDKSQAMAILGEGNLFPLTDEEGKSIHCPKCQSENIDPGYKGIRSFPAFFSYLLSLLTFTYPLYSDTLKCCRDCKHYFK